MARFPGGGGFAYGAGGVYDGVHRSAVFCAWREAAVKRDHVAAALALRLGGAAR
ncbi:hypothetical protein KCP69_10690 [Salmonella enterica subsp. enterica]|nr:hypothetical protein KCP69_10690 [Salmonella enterica subsp. enterica]